MHFGYPLPVWAVALIVAVAVMAGYATYGRVRALSARRRVALGGLRAAALVVLLLLLFRPLVNGAQRDRRGAVVPILVDQSASMGIRDVAGRSRADIVVEALKQKILPKLSGSFQPDILAFGDMVVRRDVDHLSAPDFHATDIEAALRSLGGRYKDRVVAGAVLLSDGGATTPVAASPASGSLAGMPVFTVGIGGSPADREVTAVDVDGDSLVGSAVDLDAVVRSRGFGQDRFDVQLVADGKTVDTRHVELSDGVPAHVRFTVPPPGSATVYSVQVPGDPREAVVENNRAAVVVTPPGRKRRILFVQGAPGFEHSFMRRAWAADPGIEVDAVVGKGKNDQGHEAYFIQADPARAPALVGGFPTTRAGLFVYDAIVFGNIEWDFLTRDQLAMTADFVRERGGGVLLFGARSFASPGLAGTPLADALPLQLTTGRPSIALTSNVTERPGENKFRVTQAGRDHAILRVAASREDNDRAWAALPSLAGTNVLGPARPGASVLAETTLNGRIQPLLAIERYGRGRTVEFAGEGSWRWKMLMPASDRTHEMFWRQVLRWLSAAAPEPVSIVPANSVQPGAAATLDVLAANGEFRAAGDAAVTLRVTSPDGDVRTVKATLADASAGRYSARVQIRRPGLYIVDADARQGAALLGTASQPVLAGASNPEFADPRLNEAVLQRIAADSGGRYLRVDDVGALGDLLHATARAATAPAQPRDIWQHPIVLALLLGALATEWVLRRRWGLA